MSSSGDDVEALDRAIRFVDYHLRRLHLPPLPLHLYEYYNNTLPDAHKTVRVACLDGETEAACDARVDQLNAAW
ncbi:hypothetical protein E2C01_073739 [Portunus trituberculatus]|uniref:Uncharacterized protein n=1 Tax=Portunus trituberculatus TaxID=210409 RepID=A0A5B7IA92_PORTR|nr:hypothetical protein [Portunus trituberculatus]